MPPKELCGPRLLLGLKGTISEFELVTIRNRLERGRLHKGQRGELFHGVPTGYVTLFSDRVKEAPEFYRQMMENGLIRAREFAIHRIAAGWREVLAGPVAEGFSVWAARPALWKSLVQPALFAAQAARNIHRKAQVSDPTRSRVQSHLGSLHVNSHHNCLAHRFGLRDRPAMSAHKMKAINEQFLRSIDNHAWKHHVPVVRFEKGKLSV